MFAKSQSMSRTCAQRHNGFNLVVGDLRTRRAAYVTNRGPEGACRGPRELSPGLHALSNATLGEGWPKVPPPQHAVLLYGIGLVGDSTTLSCMQPHAG